MVLTAAIPTEGLEAGDVGTIVPVCEDGKALEVEPLTPDGKMAAVDPVETCQVRPVTSHDIAHAREIAVIA